MKKPTPKPLVLAGALAVTAAASALSVPGTVHAQAVTASMSINMTIASAATVTTTGMNFGNVAPVAGGTATLPAAGGLLTGLGFMGAPTGTAGAVTVARSMTMTATLALPSAAVTMSCGTATVTVSNWTSVTSGANCGTQASTTCGWGIGADVAFPNVAIPTGACTATSTTVSLTYGQ